MNLLTYLLYCNKYITIHYSVVHGDLQTHLADTAIRGFAAKCESTALSILLRGFTIEVGSGFDVRPGIFWVNTLNSAAEWTEVAFGINTLRAAEWTEVNASWICERTEEAFSTSASNVCCASSFLGLIRKIVNQIKAH